MIVYSVLSMIFAKALSHGIKNLYLPAAQRNETGNAK
jgi:hypothetical protein